LINLALLTCPSAPGSGAAAPPVTRLQGAKEQVAAVGWSHDCGTLVTADKAGCVAFWQLTGGGGGGGGS
jgi:hypothetical protein